MSVLRAIDRGLMPLSYLVAAVAVLALFAGPELIGAKGLVQKVPSGKASATPAPAADGKTVFASAGCGGCHTLGAAGASGAIGPNLDQLKPDAATVAATVKAGAGGMPSFSGKLSDAEIQAVAQFVSTSAGG